MEREPDQEWTVAFRHDPDDLVAERRRTRRLEHHRETVIKAVFCLSFFAGLGSLIGLATGAPLRVTIATGAGLGGLLYWRILGLAERELVRDATLGGHLRNQTLTISPAGFEHRFEDGRRLSCPWTNVVKVATTPKYALIQTEDKQLSVLVPLAAFDSNSSAAIFLSMAKHWHSQAIGPDVKSP